MSPGIESWPGRNPRFVADKGGDMVAAGVSQDNEITKGQEIISEGLLSEYLQSDFLHAYLKDKPQHYAEIPKVIDHTLALLFISEGVERVDLTGSIARCIASGVPPHFWDYSRSFSDDIEMLEYSEDKDALQIISGLTGDAAADMDLKVWSRDTEPLSALFDAYIQWFKVPGDHVKEVEVVKVNGRQYVGKQTKFSYPNDPRFTIELFIGPIATNVDRKAMRIALFDSSNNQRIFRVDIGEMSKGAIEEAREKRVGKTSLKQDECRAHLEFRRGHLYYYLPRSAKEVMEGQDEITTESDKPGDVVEIFLRALRMNLLHEVTELKCEDGTILKLPKLDMPLPQFTSESLFRLRKHIHDLVLSGKQIESNIVPLIQKELALCLTIDPYVTIQALRDSDVGMLIPGLRQLTREQWEKLFTSYHLMVRSPWLQREQRTISVMEEERRVYRYGDEKRRLWPRFDGLEAFVLALRDMRILKDIGLEWSSYLQLWKQPVANREVEGTYRSKFELDVPPGINSEQLYKGWEVIVLRSKETTLGELYKKWRELGLRQKLDAALQEDRDEATAVENHLQSVALAYSILEQFPSGITPRGLFRLYTEAQVEFSKDEDFKKVFFDLKSMGVVQKYEQKRYNAHCAIEPVAFYALRTGPVVNPLPYLVADESFQEYLQSRGELGHRADLFMFGMVEVSRFAPTVEAFVAMGKKDFDVIRHTLMERKQADALAGILDDLLTEMQAVCGEYLKLKEKEV